LHGALLDAEILADVYLLMTGGQTALSLGGNQSSNKDSGGGVDEIRRIKAGRTPLPVILATVEELEVHEQKLASINKSSNGNCIWLKDTTLVG
jgi:DNA polymerase-3 subunit epsilon